MSKLLRFLSSVKSIFFINFLIKIKKLLNKDLKIIFFYFPVKSYQNNILELIDEIKKEKNIEVILSYNLGSSEEIKKYDKAFFLNLGYLRYIKNIDIFLSSYVVYEFPDSLNKIYINHDIYDTPMVNPEKEENLITALKKCNFIFLSSDIAITALQRKFDQYSKMKDNKEKISLVNTGYLKLDHVYKKLTNNKKPEDTILLAPTLSSMLTHLNLDEFLEPIIDELLKNTEFKLIYRPHPGDKNDSKKKLMIQNIVEKNRNNERFLLDDNTSYIESYLRSKILITDFSGTAYTYAFSKIKPVIFFSKNENKLVESDLNKLFFFKDRINIGTIVQNIDNLNEEIYSINKQIDYFSNKIKLLRSNRIKYFNKSMEQNLLILKKILNVKEN